MTAARVVASGPALSPEDVADRMAAIRDTYSTDGDGRVVVVDGFGCKVTVHHGALVVADGIGEHRRERTYGKVAPPVRLVVAGDGMLTTEALSWCRAQGTAVVILRAGDVLLGASPPGRDDARLRRQQALAGVDGSPVGLGIVRFLLTEKLRGQAANLARIFSDEDTASTVLELAGGIEVAERVDEARQIEAVAAALYFAAWSGHPATAVAFAAKDRPRVPPHWQTFDSRRSSITGAANTNRLAERPTNALLNYCYRLAEVEARFACVRLGLDPGLGVLHLDAPGRDSLALDVMEPLRPQVDRFVLDLLAGRSFGKRTFVERSDGAVRVAGPLTHELAATLPTWRQAVAPHAETVAHLFVDEIAGKTSKTTPLSGRKGRAAAEQVRRRKAAEAREQAERAHAQHRATQPVRRPTAPAPERAATALAGCVDCGGQVSSRDRVRCDSCIDSDPRQAPGVRAKRASAIASRKRALREQHAAGLPPHCDRDWYRREVVPALAGVKLAQIMEAAQCSKGFASVIRSGKYAAHPSNWPALATLAGVRLAMEKALDLRDQCIDDALHDAAAVAGFGPGTVDQDSGELIDVEPSGMPR